MMNKLNLGRMGLISAWLCALALAGCGSDDSSPPVTSAGLTLCQCYWGGPLSYDGESLTVRTCLNEDNCSEELTFLLNWDSEVPSPGGLCTAENPCDEAPYEGRGIAKSYDNFSVLVGMLRWDEGSGKSTSFVATHDYFPEFAATLSDADRPTLTVATEEGEVIIDTESTIPYQSHTSTPGGGPPQTCKTLWLNLDGTPRPLPYD